jgi:Zn-dependent protease
MSIKQRFKKISFTIHPGFLMIAALLGFYQSQGSLMGAVLWMLVIFLSVFVHEMGHALTAMFFGQTPHVEFVSMGGVTSYRGKALSSMKRFFVILNGPLFGFFFYLGARGMLHSGFSFHPLLTQMFWMIQVMNFWWSVFNLVPLFPLDGGQLMKVILEGWLGPKGTRVAFFLGFLMGFIGGLTFLALGNFIAGALFFYFTYENFEFWRRSKSIRSPDQKNIYQKELRVAEKALASGNKEKAKKHFEQIRKDTKEGVIFSAASYYLALLLVEEKKHQEAYELLKPIKEDLPDEAKSLLQKIAFEIKDYALVADLSSFCYQMTPTEEVALRNAKAFGYLNSPQYAGGWLHTAIKFNRLKLDSALEDEAFEKVKDKKAFLEFFS